MICSTCLGLGVHSFCGVTHPLLSRQRSWLSRPKYFDCYFNGGAAMQGAVPGWRHQHPQSPWQERKGEPAARWLCPEPWASGTGVLHHPS